MGFRKLNCRLMPHGILLCLSQLEAHSSSSLLNVKRALMLSYYKTLFRLVSGAPNELLTWTKQIFVKWIVWQLMIWFPLAKNISANCLHQILVQQSYATLTRLVKFATNSLNMDSRWPYQLTSIRAYLVLTMPKNMIILFWRLFRFCEESNAILNKDFQYIFLSSTSVFFI